MSPRISIRLLAAQSDQRLLALARDGHERAFEALVQRYRRPLLRYGRRLQLSEARAEDVLQQALMQAWIALSRGTAVHDVRGWLYRIVHNVALNAIRGGAAEPHRELTPALRDRAALAGPSNLDRSIALRDALGEVAELPRMQRQAIFLTAVDGQTHSEVADTLGLSEGALRGLLYRARATLRSAAAALTPPPLLAWAAGGGGTAAPSVERLTELTAGGSAAGIAGLFLKGSVIAVTAGAVATGAGVVATHDHHAARHRQTARIASASTVAPPVGLVDRFRSPSLDRPASVPGAMTVDRLGRAHRRRRDHAGGRGRRGSDDAGRGRHDLPEPRIATPAGGFEDSQVDRRRRRGQGSVETDEDRSATGTQDRRRGRAEEVEVSDVRHGRSARGEGQQEHRGGPAGAGDSGRRGQDVSATGRTVGPQDNRDQGGGSEDEADEAHSGSDAPPLPSAEEGGTSSGGGRSGQSGASSGQQAASSPSAK